MDALFVVLAIFVGLTIGILAIVWLVGGFDRSRGCTSSVQPQGSQGKDDFDHLWNCTCQTCREKEINRQVQSAEWEKMYREIERSVREVNER